MNNVEGKESPVYATDLMEVLHSLKQMSGQWTLHIEPVGNDEVNAGEPWQAYLSLVAGQITTCQVYSRVDGRLLLLDQEALGWLANLRHFNWRLEPLSLPQAPAVSRYQPFLAQQVPRRITQVEKGVIQAWPRKQRQVFGLVDGSRTIEQIAILLHQPPEEIAQILDGFGAMGVIQR